jgi:uncharacterized protein
MDNFRFFDLKIYPFADPEAAVAEVKAQALIKATGRTYHQDYVLFWRAAGDNIAFLPEYSIPCVWPGRWIRRFLVSNPEGER